MASHDPSMSVFPANVQNQISNVNKESSMLLSPPANTVHHAACSSASTSSPSISNQHSNADKNYASSPMSIAKATAGNFSHFFTYCKFMVYFFEMLCFLFGCTQHFSILAN